MSAKKNNLAQKKKALNYFQRQILVNGKKNDIAKIYLFGSMLKESKVRDESDIDLAIFTRRAKDRKLENLIDQTAFDTVVEYGQSVEPLIYSFKDFQQPKSAFLKRVIQEGRELYSTL